MIEQLSLIGGIFSILTFIHFFSDWIFQSHSEAMVKHCNSLIRAKHCFIYCLWFIPLFLLINLSFYKIFICLNILFWSHFFEDTYYLVFLWAKYIRKPPEMLDNDNGFIDFVSTSLGKILMITIDQIIHLLFLFPVSYIICKN